MKYKEFTADQKKERAQVFTTWLTDVMNSLIDEIEMTNHSQTLDLEQNKFVINELLM